MGKRGPKPVLPTEEERAEIRKLAGIGFTQEQIGVVIGKSVDWMAKHCREDLDIGMSETKAKVGHAIVEAALAGNMTAAIFYAKTQMGWKETSVTEHTGKDGQPIETRDVTDREALIDEANRLGIPLEALGLTDPASKTGSTKH